MVTRKAAWAEGAPANGWSDDLIWYAAAMNRMKALTPRLDDLPPIAEAFIQQRGQLTNRQQAEANSIIKAWSDPRSLGYQAQVHATFMSPSAWPSYRSKRVLWQECAHGNLFFLPWHRAYLLEFEAVARQHVRELGGPADTWALPYWNSSDYADHPAAAGLPLALRGRSLPPGVVVPGVEARPDGSFPNPLYDATREMTGDAPTWRRANAGLWTDASDALSRRHFATAQDAQSVSFGGGYLEDITLFHIADELGQLDGQPHGTVHSAVNGNMGLFETAGLDPVFWMHHANVDRLWETYARDLGHGYPFEDGTPAGPAHDSWSSQVFRFLRPDGRVFEWTAPMVVDLASLDYRYDTTAPPRILPVLTDPPGQDDDPFGLAGEAYEPVAAASEVPVAQAIEVELTGGEQGQDGSGLGLSGTGWVLRFDGIRAARPALTSYQVYLGLRAASDADPTDRTHFVGVLSLFGVFEASWDDGGFAASGQSRRFVVTSLVRGLGVGFDPLHAVVWLVPLDPDRDLDEVGLSVGRVSLDVR